MRVFYIYIYIFMACRKTVLFLKYYSSTIKVKCSCYRPGVAQRVGRGIALLFHDRDTRRGWVVSSTPRPHFTPGKVPVPIVQEAGWAPGTLWTSGKSLPYRNSIPDRPARSQSLYRLSYRPTLPLYCIDDDYTRVNSGPIDSKTVNFALYSKKRLSLKTKITGKLFRCLKKKKKQESLQFFTILTDCVDVGVYY